MVILATEGLTKNFGGLRATDSLNLAIEEGKLTSVIGPNGAGKTTLFNLITGMIRPDAGRVVFRGRRDHRPPGVSGRPTRHLPLVPDHQFVQ